MGLEEVEQIKPFVGATLQAPVVQVVAVNVNSCPQKFPPRSEKTGFRRLFPPPAQQSSWCSKWVSCCE